MELVASVKVNARGEGLGGGGAEESGVWGM